MLGVRYHNLHAQVTVTMLLYTAAGKTFTMFTLLFLCVLACLHLLSITKHKVQVRLIGMSVLVNFNLMMMPDLILTDIVHEFGTKILHSPNIPNGAMPFGVARC